MEINRFNQNVTNYTNTPSTHELDYFKPNFLICFILLTNILSFIANLLAMVAICFVKKLRNSLSSVYTFSLCLLGLVATTTVLPKSVAVIVNGRWAWHESLCSVNGLFNAFLVFAVILTICVRELEKYYCIRYPMHHAGRMTVMTAISSVGIAWMIAIVLALFPLVLWNGYLFRLKSLQCTYLWEKQKPNIIYGTFVSFVFLLLPLLLMLHINCTMYQIAKRAMRQIEPIDADENKVAKSRVRLSVFMTRTHGESSRKQFENSELTSKSPDIVENLKIYPARPSSCLTVNDSAIMRDNLFRSGTNYKALKSLILPFVYFVAIWGSYFITHFTWLIGIFQKSYFTETICTLVVYSSYLLNPFVYGFFNKSFRDECYVLMQERMCASRTSTSSTTIPPACENLIEFLQRTSYQGQVTDAGRKPSTEERGFIRPSVIVCREGMPTVDM